MANAVRFIYVPAGKSLPDAIERSKSAIYFVEDAQQLWVGDKLIADHIDPADISAYLEPYKIKSVEITGEGSFLSSAIFDDTTGKLTLTKATPPVIERGVDGEATAVSLTPGSSFTVVTDTPVSDNKLYNESKKFTLPAQISGIAITKDNDSTNLILTITSTDGTNTTSKLSMFKSAAYTDASDYATAAQGAKADAAMPADGGTATDALVTLKRDPEANLEAATKQYVDNAVSGLTGAMHFLGISSTKITDGGREHPKINGSEVDTSSLNPGDVVLYSPNKDGQYLEFVWAEDSTGTGYWAQLGDETSYAHKDVQIIAGEGASGGGTLASDVTISHGSTGSGNATDYHADSSTLSAVSGFSVDKFGHVDSVRYRNIGEGIDDKVSAAVADAIAEDDSIAHADDIPSWKVVE